MVTFIGVPHCFPYSPFFNRPKGGNMYRYTDSTGLEIHRFGRLELYLKPKGWELDRATLHVIGEIYGPYLTLSPEDYRALMRTLQCLFEDQANVAREILFNSGHCRKSGFFFLGRLVDSDLFWISSGPLNVYIPLEDMRKVYADMRSAGYLVHYSSLYIYL